MTTTIRTTIVRGIRFIEPLLVALFFLAIWEVGSRSGLLPRDSIPPPTEITTSLVEQLQRSDVWNGAWETFRAWAIGMAIAIAIGIPIGILLGISSLAYHSGHFLLEFMRTVPAIAALPFLILTLGTTPKLMVVMVILSATWPLMIQTMYGVRDVDPLALETGRVYGLGRRGQLWRIIFPSSVPYIATGLRVAGVLGLIVAIATSLVAGGNGLGELIATAQNTGDVTLMYARIGIAALVGVAITFSLYRLERRCLRWHPSQRKDLT